MDGFPLFLLIRSVGDPQYPVLDNLRRITIKFKWGKAAVKVFISWSGKETKSHAVARALDEWLPTVLNAVEPWMSSRGLSAGLQWNQQLDKELDDTSFGIIVVTPWNQHSQWLNFESGALSKRVGGVEARVAPLLVDFPNAVQLTGPLASYQAVFPTQEGIRSLVDSINAALGDARRTFEAIDRAFKVCWPALQAKLKEIEQSMPSEEDPGKAPTPQPAAADETDMLSEILDAVRSLARSDARLRNEIRKNTSVTAASHNANDPIAVRKSSRERRDSSIARLNRDLVQLGYPVISVSADGGKMTVFLAHPITKDEEVEMVGSIDWDDYGVHSIRVVPDALDEVP